MNSDEGRISFSAEFDNAKLRRQVADAQRAFEQLADNVEADGSRMDDALGGIGNTLASLGAAWSMKEFARKVADVRGEFQKLEVAMETMLQSKEKAEALMAQMVQTAATTPFGLQEVAGGAKQLLAYGLEAEKVNETLIRLGDIAAGLSIPLGDLVYLYGTTMTQGRLYTQDFNQFVGRGIPLVSELAKEFGVAESKVKGLVEEGKVGFPEIQKVIENLTNEGGMFGGLMEKQSQTISGQIANIEDAFDMMFNEIGQNNEGIINGALSTVSSLVENYERVGRVIAGVVVTYGTYKAAVMAVCVAEKLKIKLMAEAAVQQALVAMQGHALSNAQAMAAAKTVILNRSLQALNKTMLANPWVLAATAVAGLVTLLISLKTESERVAEAEKKYQEQLDETIRKEEEHKNKISELLSIAGNEALSTDIRREALVKLEQQYPSIFAKYDSEYAKLQNIKQIKEEIAALDGQNSITKPSNELAEVNKRIKELEKEIAREWDDYGGGTYVANPREAEKAELKMLQNRRNLLQETVNKERADAYLTDLTGVSNKSLQAQIKERQNLLAKMQLEGKKYGRATKGGAKGTYNADELQGQLQILEAELNSRNADRYTPGERKAQLKKALDEANKALKDFDKSSTKYTVEEAEQKRKELQEAVESAEKEYKNFGGSVDKKSSKTDTAAERTAKIQKAELDVQKTLKESAQSRESMMRDLQQQEEQMSIDLEIDAAEKKRRQLALDQQKEQDQLKEQQEAAIQAEIQRQKQYFDAVENEKAARDKDYVKKNFTEADIDQSEIDKIKQQYTVLFDGLEKQQKRAQADLVKGELESMRDYLKNYGSYQQQKLAIAEEYAQKIREAETEGEKRSLEKERDSQLSSIEAQELKANIDWTTVFGEFGGMFKEVITPALENAKKYVQTDEFKNSDQASQKDLIEAIRQMEESLGGADKVSFKKLGTEITAYQKALANLREAQDDYAAKYSVLEQAQDDYKEALNNGTDEEQKAAKSAVDDAQANADAAAQNVETMQGLATEAQQTVTDTATGLKTSMSNVIGGLQQLSSGSLSGAYAGLIQFGKGAKNIGGKLGEAFGKISDTLEDVPIVGWIVSIIDLFKDGISTVISGLLDAVFNAVSGIIDDVLSGDLFRSIGESLLSGISKIFDSITWGGFSSWLGNGDSDKNLAKDIERLATTNEALQYAIEELTDKLDEASMTDAAELYSDQKKLLAESEANTQQQMSRMGAAYSNGTFGIGGHKSSNSKINNSMSSSDWSRISKITGATVRNAGEFWTLTSEQMRQLATDAPDLYAKIKDLADNGYRNAAQYMDEYIDYAKQREELEEAYFEKLTDMSFDSLRDEFKECLTDMEMSASDFSENFNEMLVDSIAEALMTNKYDPMIQNLYKKWATYMENDGTLDDAEIAQIIKDKNDIYAAMQSDREFLGKLSNSASSQSSSKQGFATASQDSIDELNGRFTAIQMDTNSIRVNLSTMQADMGALSSSASVIKQNTDEMRNISLRAIDHLETISKNTHELYEMNERLGKIEKNTRNI